MKKKLTDQQIKTERIIFMAKRYMPLVNSLEYGRISRDEFFRKLEAIFKEMEEWDQKYGWD